MKDITLVILAAGMGSRFGGLKQIEPLGPNGEFIIDYSVYDAIKAGFNKIVFLIKEENYEEAAKVRDEIKKLKENPKEETKRKSEDKKLEGKNESKNETKEEGGNE